MTPERPSLNLKDPFALPPGQLGFWAVVQMLMAGLLLGAVVSGLDLLVVPATKMAQVLHSTLVLAALLLGAIAWGSRRLGIRVATWFSGLASPRPAWPLVLAILRIYAWIGLFDLIYCRLVELFLPSLLENLPSFGWSGWLSILVVAPLLEEILFRGVILQGLSAAYGDRAGLLLSALLFGLAHGNLYQFGSCFFFGLVLAWLARRERSLVPCIGVHLVNNLFAYGLFLWPGRMRMVWFAVIFGFLAEAARTSLLAGYRHWVAGKAKASE